MRRGGRSPVALVSSGPPPDEPLGSNLVEFWDSKLGLSLAASNTEVTSWTGQKLGLVVGATGTGARPFYTAATSTFRNFPSITTANSGLRGLKMAADHGSDIVANGGKPWIGLVASLDAFGAGGRIAMALASASGTTLRMMLFMIDADTFAGRVNNDSGTSADYDTTDTNPHAWEFLIESDNQLVLYRDGAEVARDATGSALGSAVRQVSLGFRTSTGSNAIDMTVVWAGICTAPPSADERAAWLASVKARYGTP